MPVAPESPSKEDMSKGSFGGGADGEVPPASSPIPNGSEASIDAAGMVLAACAEELAGSALPPVRSPRPNGSGSDWLTDAAQAAATVSSAVGVTFGSTEGADGGGTDAIMGVELSCISAAELATARDALASVCNGEVHDGATSPDRDSWTIESGCTAAGSSAVTNGEQTTLV